MADSATDLNRTLEHLLSDLEQAATGLNATARDRDRKATFPLDEWRTLASTGIFRSTISGSWGGYDLGVLDLMRAAERLGELSVDAGLNFSVATHIASTAFALNRFGSHELQEHYLHDVGAGALIGSHAITEPLVGSDAVNLKSTGQIDADAIVLNGEKTFITNGPVADLTVVYVRTDPDAGPLGLTAVLLPRDTPGAVFSAALEKSALRTSPVGTLSLQECRLPRANILGGVGAGFLILNQVMNWEILISFSINIGEMQRRLQTVVNRTRQRHQFGQPLADFQGIQNQVAEMHIAIVTARLALAAAGRDVADGRKPTRSIAVAKVLASRANIQTAQQSVEIFGGAGILTESGIEVGIRDASAGPIYSGTNAIQLQKIARAVGI